VKRPTRPSTDDTDERTDEFEDAEPGPSLLTERTLTGIFIHPLGLLSGVALPGVVYLLTDHPFTRENARTVLNWHLFYLSVLVGVLFGFALTFVVDAILPDFAPFDWVVLVLLLLVVVGTFVLAILTMLTMLFSVVGMAKAVFGTPWEYPFAPDLLEWGRELTN
jgi:uncharacterized Tic20 family protein